MHPRQKAWPQLSKLMASIMYPWHNGQANAADISPILTYIIQKYFFKLVSITEQKFILNLCLIDNPLRLVHLLALNLDLIMIEVTLVMSKTVNVPFQFRCSIRDYSKKIKQSNFCFFFGIEKEDGYKNPFEGM